MLRTLWNDEHGFVISAELVLVATLLVIGLIVGMSQIQHAVATELNDVAHAIGSLNQSYSFRGFRALGSGAHAGTKSFVRGSAFHDAPDDCDCADITCAAQNEPTPECGP